MLKNKKNISSLFLYNAAYNALNVFFPLITIPYLSRILLADGIGKVNFARSVVTWFVMFASLGIPRYGIREVARNKDDTEKLSMAFSELIIINALSTSVCVILYITIILIFPFFQQRRLLFIATGIQLLLNYFNVDWFFRGIEEFAYITKRNFVVKILSLLGILLLVRTSDDYIKYAFIQGFAVAGNYILNFIYIRKHVTIRIKGLNLKKHLMPVFILLSTSFATTIYGILDTTILGIFCSDRIVGYYSNCHKIIDAISTLTASLGGVLLTKLVYYYQKKDLKQIEQLSIKVFQIIVTICMPIVITLITFSDKIVFIVFGTDFEPCKTTLAIFALFVLFTTVGNLFGTQLLMTLNKEKELFFSVCIGAILNLFINLCVVKRFQQNGVAFSSVITEGVVMVIQYYMVSKVLTVKLSHKFVISTGLMSISFYFSLMIANYINNIFVSIIISFLIGLIIYCMFGFFLKQEVITTFLKRKR